MSRRFDPRLSILPAAQRRLWPELVSIPDYFVLYRGTALALHLGHRDSIDFDFFALQDIDPAHLFRTVPLLKGAKTIQREANTLTCLVNRKGSIKLSFFGLPRFRQLRAPHVSRDNGLRVAALDDLAATKAAVVQKRAEAKDYIDLDALLSAGIELPRALAAAKAIYGAEFTPTPTLKALTYFADGDLINLSLDIQQRLTRAAASVDPLDLPTLRARRKSAR